MTATGPSSNPFKRLCRLAGSDLSPDQRLRAAIEIGCEHLAADRGVFSRIENGAVEVAVAVPASAATTSTILEKTWSRHVITYGEPFGFADVEESPYRDDTAREHTDTAWYLGAPIVVDGELVGTVSFSDPEPGPPLTDDEYDFVDILAGWISDQLDRKQLSTELEELREQNQHLTEFAHLVAHDLRNPLTGAMGFAELAAEGADEPLATYLGHVIDSLDRMEALISECLVLAESGETVDDCTELDLARVAHTAWETIETRDATLSVETDRTIVADEMQLRRLFENLFRNSVEHGGREVTVTVSDRPDGFAVANDGPELPEDVETALAAGDTDRLKSFGLGLVIVTRIVDGHGWELTATSSSNGVTFAVDGVTVVDAPDQRS